MNRNLTSSRTRRAAAVTIGLGGVLAAVVAGVGPASAATVHSAAAAHTSVTQPARFLAQPDRFLAHPDGWVAVQSCTSVSGSVTFVPGLAKRIHAESAVLTATLNGCSLDGNPVSGQGTLSAVLSGKADVASQNLSGTYTISWPAGEGLNSSNGSVTISGPNSNVIGFAGTGTSGAFTGLPASTALFVTGHTGNGTAKSRMTSESLVSSQPLQVLENLG